jgi:two-component system NtrC family sensor kinase
MIVTYLPIWAVDVVGSILMIVLAVGCLGLSLKLKHRDANTIVWTYLLWICWALTIFAVSRSMGHIIKQLLMLTSHADLWNRLSPVSGAINTFTFIAVATLTLFFEQTWKIYRQMANDQQALQSTHQELLYLNQNLGRMVEERTAALAISEAKYRQIFEVSKDMILVTRKNGVILTINPTGLKLVRLGQDWRKQGRHRFQDYLSGRQAWKTILDAIAKEGFISSAEFDLKDSRGALRRILLSGTLSKAGDDSEEIIQFMVKDIQQQQLIRDQMAQADKLASIGELSAGVAHEINNPLGIILGYTQLLLRNEAAGSERFLDLKTIEKHVRNCKAIVEDLLNFARTSQPKKEFIQVHGIIDEVLAFIDQHGDWEQVSLEKAYDPNLPELFLDGKKIKQVLINLFMNARHAVDKKGLIQVITQLDETGTNAVIRISDTGHGIKKNDLPRIFDPFFTTKPTGQGTGLGLSVSYGIVKNHGGRIDVQSRPGHGACFSIVLPLPVDDRKSA